MTHVPFWQVWPPGHTPFGIVAEHAWLMSIATQAPAWQARLPLQTPFATLPQASCTSPVARHTPL
jgi:hypothetical protein